MSLIKCPECGRENVSDTAAACPNCGFNIGNYIQSQQNAMNNQQAAPYQQPVQQMPTQQMPYQQPAYNQPMYPNQAMPGNMPPQNPKKSNKGLIIGIIVALVIIIGAVTTVLLINNAKEKAREEEEMTEYIEKDHVSSDTQLCHSIRTAMETSAVDAAIANEPDYKPFEKGDSGSVLTLTRGGSAYMSSYRETLGIDDTSDVREKIKSTLGKKEGDIKYIWVSDSSVVVYIDNTDKNGSIDEPHKISSKDCQCIYSGPVELIQD